MVAYGREKEVLIFHRRCGLWPQWNVAPTGRICFRLYRANYWDIFFDRFLAQGHHSLIKFSKIYQFKKKEVHKWFEMKWSNPLNQIPKFFSSVKCSTIHCFRDLFKSDINLSMSPHWWQLFMKESREKGNSKITNPIKKYIRKNKLKFWF